jgi:23S rRNA pseudouridine1911/1915/1917 synthase
LSIEQHSVPEALHGARLDQAAVVIFPDYSRSRLSAWIKSGRLTLNGETGRPKDKVAVGDQLALRPEAEPAVSWSAQAMPLAIVYEDDDVIVVNKPAGLVVHPAAGHADGTLVNALLAHEPYLDKLPRAGIVHRLDKDTSGIMFVARSERAHKSLVSQLSQRTVSRHYLAVCQGALTAGGMIDAPMSRHPTQRTKMAVVRDGKPAVTHYRIRQRFAHFTALDVQLETGRTHQIRVHMAYRKMPLLGDPLYGGRQRMPPGASTELATALQGWKRQALHAYHLMFQHPATLQTVDFTVPIPEDLAQLLAVLSAHDILEDA